MWRSRNPKPQSPRQPKLSFKSHSFTKAKRWEEATIPADRICSRDVVAEFVQGIIGFLQNLQKVPLNLDSQ